MAMLTLWPFASIALARMCDGVGQLWLGLRQDASCCCIKKQFSEVDAEGKPKYQTTRERYDVESSAMDHHQWSVCRAVMPSSSPCCRALSTCAANR